MIANEQGLVLHHQTRTRADLHLEAEILPQTLAKSHHLSEKRRWDVCCPLLHAGKRTWLPAMKSPQHCLQLRQGRTLGNVAGLCSEYAVSFDMWPARPRAQSGT